MNTSRTCPQCHQPLPDDAPEGLCPQCLMKELAAATNVLPPGSTPSRDTVDIADAAEVARRLPQFEIIELLGRGGMGVVYKARQVQLDRLVALKILPPEDSHSPDFVERFRREARSLAKLSHPNIVNVHDFGEGGGLYYIVMEFVEGANLRQLIQSKQLSAPQALAIVPKICDALQYAHEEGVMHRDIKPENILMDKKGRVKIADFGLAKLLHRDPAEALLTRSGMTLGTPRYMAPEQMDKPESVDHRADIYSLGVVFYEMLTGEVPMGRFAPPSEKVQIDVKLDEIVLHAMERDVERRYQHVSEVRDDVEKVTGAAGVKAPTTPPAATPVPQEPDDDDDAEVEHSIFSAWAGRIIALAAVILAFFNPWGTKAWYYFAAGCAIYGVLSSFGFRRRSSKPEAGAAFPGTIARPSSPEGSDRQPSQPGSSGRRLLGVPGWFWPLIAAFLIVAAIFVPRPSDMPEPMDMANLFNPTVLITPEGGSYRFLALNEQDKFKPVYAVTWTTTANQGITRTFGWDAKNGLSLGFFHRAAAWRYQMLVLPFGNWTGAIDPARGGPAGGPLEIAPGEFAKLRPLIVAELERRSAGRGKLLEDIFNNGRREESVMCWQNLVVLLAWLSLPLALCAVVLALVPRSLGTGSVALAVGGMVLPCLIALGAQWFAGPSRLSDLVTLCFVLGVLLELAALGCGIIARKTASGKAGAFIAGATLVLSFLLVSVKARATGGKMDAPSVETFAARASSISNAVFGTGLEIREDQSQIPSVKSPGRTDYAYTFSALPNHRLFVWLEWWKDGKLTVDNGFNDGLAPARGRNVAVSLHLTFNDGKVASPATAGQKRIDWSFGDSSGTGTRGDWRPDFFAGMGQTDSWGSIKQWTPKVGETITLLEFRGGKNSILSGPVTDEGLRAGHWEAAMVLKARFEPVPESRLKEGSQLVGNAHRPGEHEPNAAMLGLANQFEIHLGPFATDADVRAMVADRIKQSSEVRSKIEQILRDMGVAFSPDEKPVELVKKLEKISVEIGK